MQVLLAWNTNTVLVSFRGTASLANALADIQVAFMHSGSLHNLRNINTRHQ